MNCIKVFPSPVYNGLAPVRRSSRCVSPVSHLVELIAFLSEHLSDSVIVFVFIRLFHRQRRPLVVVPSYFEKHLVDVDVKDQVQVGSSTSCCWGLVKSIDYIRIYSVLQTSKRSPTLE